MIRQAGPQSGSPGQGSLAEREVLTVGLDGSRGVFVDSNAALVAIASFYTLPPVVR